MKLIKIINGTYGYSSPTNKSVQTKTVNDAPFEVTSSEAKRLVTLNIAAYVEMNDEEDSSTTTTTSETSLNGIATLENDEEIPPADLNTHTTETDEIPLSEGTPTYNADMPVAELKAILDDCGLTYKAGMNRVEMVAMLDDYFSSEEDDDAAPNLNPEEPVI